MPISVAISQQSTVISSSAPTNPAPNSQWVELDSNNLIVERWYWVSNSWRSEVKSWVGNLSMNNSSIALNYYLPLPSEYDYYLRYCLITVTNLNSALTSSNYIRVKVTANENNNTPSTTPSVDINNQTSSDFIVVKTSWNYLLSSTASNKGLRVLINKNGSTTGDLNIQYFYQTIRK